MRLEVPDVKGAVWDLVIWGGVDSEGSRLDPGRVFHGRQNRTSLPPGSEEYAVITHLSSARVGTNIETYLPDAEEASVSTHWTADFQVDFCSSSARTAFERATSFESLASSAAGALFLQGRGVNLIESGGLRDLSGYVDAEQFVCRAQTVLRVEYGSRIGLAQEGSAGPLLGRYIENVDVHHPPKE
jgi:hypothetical protein